MDIRSVGKEAAKQEYFKQQDEKLTDSLIFNIIKKIQLKETMEQKYDAIRLPQVKDIPYGVGKHIHSVNGVAYFIGISAWLLHGRYKNKKSLKFASFIPHIVIAVSINEFDRYRGLMNLNPELTNEYKSYQQNTQTVIQQMRRRVSLIKIIKESRLISVEKIIQMVKYKPIY